MEHKVHILIEGVDGSDWGRLTVRSEDHIDDDIMFDELDGVERKLIYAYRDAVRDNDEYAYRNEGNDD